MADSADQAEPGISRHALQPTAGGRPTVMEPTAYNLAGVYAEALLDVLPQDDQAALIAAELVAIVAECWRLEEFESFWKLTRSLMNDEQRVELAERIFDGRVSGQIARLLAVMARNGRLELLPTVAERFGELLNRRAGRIEVDVTTAVPLTDAAKQKLANTLRRALGAEPVLRAVVDKNVLGGAVLRVGDRLYDASVATELDRLKRQLADRIAPNVAAADKAMETS